MLGTLTDRVHTACCVCPTVRARTRQGVVDDDASPDREARLAGQAGFRPDAGRDDDKVAGDRGAVLQLDALHVIAASHGRCGRACVNDEPQLLQLPLQDPSALGVELRIHDVAHQVHHVHLEPERQQSLRRFEPEETAADDHGGPRAPRRGHDPVAVFQGPEREHTGSQALACLGIAVACSFKHAIDRRDHRPAAGRDHERVVLLFEPAGGTNAPGFEID